MSEWRALSLSQPWLDWIMRAARGERDEKLVENREWSTSHRGPFILHAAKSFDAAAFDAAVAMGLPAPPRLPREKYPSGGFVGVARLVDVLRPGQLPYPPGAWDLRWWARTQFGFLLSDVREVPQIAYPGSLNFWKVPAATVAQLFLPPTPEEWV
jgi:hypothetical protein